MAMPTAADLEFTISQQQKTFHEKMVPGFLSDPGVPGVRSVGVHVKDVWYT